jgi:hypothetical protein
VMMNFLGQPRRRIADHGVAQRVVFEEIDAVGNP